MAMESSLSGEYRSSVSRLVARVDPRVLLVNLAGLILAVALGRALALGSSKPILLFAGVTIITVIAFVPWLAYPLILLLVASVADPYHPYPQISSFYVSELAFLAIVATVLLVATQNPQLLAASFGAEGVVLAIFFVAILGGLFVGIQNGAQFHEAFTEMRAMIYYAAFWPAAIALSVPRWRRKLFWFAASLAVFVTFVQFAQFLLGGGTTLFLGAADQFVTSEEGTIRVRAPGLLVVYTAGAAAACYLLWGPQRRRLVALGVVTTALVGIALSQNRNMLIGLALGVGAAVLVVPRKARALTVLAGLAGVVAVAGTLVLFRPSFAEAHPLAARFLQVSDYSSLRAETLNDRYYENRLALAAIKKEPITGIGWGRSYGAYVRPDVNGEKRIRNRPFVHFQYFQIWLRTGLIGLVALLGLFVLALRNATRWIRIRRWDDQSWIGAAVVASLVAIAASSTVGLYLTGADAIVPLTGILALASTMPRVRQL